MNQNSPPDQLWMMLGEIRGDLKYLVEERRSTNRRLDEVEASVKTDIKHNSDRITTLEAFKIKVGVFTTALGVIVPTIVGAIAHKMGIL